MVGPVKFFKSRTGKPAGSLVIGNDDDTTTTTPITTNLSAIDEPVFLGQPVGLSTVIAGAGHPDGELVGIVRGVRGGNSRCAGAGNGTGDDRQDDDHRSGGQRHRDRGRRTCRTAGAVTPVTVVTSVRRHGRGVCYWWRQRCARPPSTPPRYRPVSRDTEMRKGSSGGVTRRRVRLRTHLVFPITTMTGFT